MKRHSIRRRITIGTSLLLSVTFLIAAVVIYRSVRESLYAQLDERLHASLSLMMIEVEIVGDRVVDDWLEDLKEDELRTKREYVQTWDLSNDKTQRSPALAGENLPKFSGEMGEEIFQNVVLEGDGTKLRAVGTLLEPVPEGGPKIDPKDHPHVMVVAFETESIDRTLRDLFWTLAIGLGMAIAVCFLGGYWFVRSSLRPIKQLEHDRTNA